MIADWNAILCMKQWQAVVLPLLLTSLMYVGSVFLKCSMLLYSCKDHWNHGGDLSFLSIKMALQTFIGSTVSIASNVSAWRNYFVVSIFTYSICLFRWYIVFMVTRFVFRFELYFDLLHICTTKAKELMTFQAFVLGAFWLEKKNKAQFLSNFYANANMHAMHVAYKWTRKGWPLIFIYTPAVWWWFVLLVSRCLGVL